MVGVLNAPINYKGTTKTLRLYIIPSIKQRLILGIDFWKEFALAPHVISAMHSTSDEFDKNSTVSTDLVDNSFPLTDLELRQLEVVKSLFPNCQEKLGRTHLIQHHIDIGDARPVKQRFYPVSPAVETLSYKEIDRMLALDVIEPSISARSSPMRLVVKPNKIRLCLDARKLNEATFTSDRRYIFAYAKSKLYHQARPKRCFLANRIDQRGKAINGVYHTWQTFLPIQGNAVWLM